MTNDYSPATPPWLQTPLPESPDNARNGHADEAPHREREQSAGSRRPELRLTEPAPPPWQRNGFGPTPVPSDESRAPVGESSSARPQPQPEQTPPRAPRPEQTPPRAPQPEATPPRAQRPPVAQSLPPEPYAQPQQPEPRHSQAPVQHFVPPQHDAQQPPAHYGPSQPGTPQPDPRHIAQVPPNNGSYQPSSDHLPKEKSEIGTDGTVRRVPFQEDRVAQMYQAPADLPPGSPVYTWSPPPQRQQHPGQWQGASQNGPAKSVNDLSLLRRAKRPPRSGWRLAVHRASGGTINPGESHADIAYRELVDRVNQPVRGDYRIAILSLKGGVGKTTTTVGLGSTFASLRGDRVIAIDANPDLGTLAHRVPKQTNSTVRSLLDDGDIHRYSDVRAHTSQAPSRLEVLASEQDPAVSEAFSEADYRSAIDILQAYYNIILTDCGTGLMHSAMTGVLEMASALVLVTSPAIDGARSASATLDWLEHHGYGKLVERTVVVVNSSRKGASSVDIDQMRKLFLDRTRAVQVVPFDDHLAEGAEIDLELVSKPTRRALLELAATVADEFQH